MNAAAEPERDGTAPQTATSPAVATAYRTGRTAGAGAPDDSAARSAPG